MTTGTLSNPLDAVLEQDLSLDFVRTDLVKFQTRATVYVKLLRILSKEPSAAALATDAFNDFKQSSRSITDVDLKNGASTAPVISREFLEALGDVAVSLSKYPASKLPAPTGSVNAMDQQRLVLLSAQFQQLQGLIMNALLTVALKFFRHNIILSSLDSESASLHTTTDEASIHAHPLISRIVDAAKLREHPDVALADPATSIVVVSSYRVCFATWKVLDCILTFIQKILTQRTAISFKTKRFNVVLNFRTQLRSLIRVVAELIKLHQELGQWMQTSTAGDAAMGVTGAFNTLREVVNLYCEAAKEVGVVKGIEIKSEHGVLDIHTYCDMAIALPDALTAQGGNGAAVGVRLLQALGATLDVLKTATKRSLENGDGPYGRRFLPLPNLPVIDVIPDSAPSERSRDDDNSGNTATPPSNAMLTIPTLVLPDSTGGSTGTTSTAGRSNAHTNYTNSIFTIDSAMRKDAESFPYDEHMGDGRYSTDALMEQSWEMDGYSDEGEADWEANSTNENGGEGVLPWDMRGSAICTGRWGAKGKDDAASYLEDDEMDRASFV